jgi:hypothetical protein
VTNGKTTIICTHPKKQKKPVLETVLNTCKLFASNRDILRRKPRGKIITMPTKEFYFHLIFEIFLGFVLGFGVSLLLIENLK